MTARGSVAWRWRAVADAPDPKGAVAWHAAAQALHTRLLHLPPERQQKLSVTAGRDVLVVTGAPADLPWAPGIAYVTCFSGSLWYPTVLQPDVPLDLLARALRRRHNREPLLLWPDPAAVIPLDRQLTVSPGLLKRIAERWAA